MSQGYEVANIRASIGSKVKIKAGGRYRSGRLLSVGRNRLNNELMVKVAIDFTEMPWSAPFCQTDWYSINLVRKADREKWARSEG